MEMRLGKTLTSIRWALHRIKVHKIRNPRILVLAPSTPLVSWMEELQREGIKSCLVRGSKKKREEILRGGGWCLMNYATLLFTPYAQQALNWDVVICDESTAIKNIRSKITKVVTRKLSQVRIRAILTGLVNPESLLEVWSQMAFCLGGSFMHYGNFWPWRQRYFATYGFDLRARPGADSAIKAAFHANAFVLTRKQAGLGSMKMREKLVGELKSKERSIYNKIISKWEVPGLQTKNALVIATWMRKLSGGHLPGMEVESWKYEQLFDLLETQLSEEPVLVWFAFNLELARVWRGCKDRGISATWVAGELEIEERKRRVKMFRDGRRRVFLCQLKCGRYGLDLSCADTEIYFSNSYSYEDRRQSEDRIEHPLKKTTLLIVDLVTANTIDEDVMDSIAKKNSSAEWFINRISEKYAK